MAKEISFLGSLFTCGAAGLAGAPALEAANTYSPLCSTLIEARLRLSPVLFPRMVTATGNP
jgi:hypothetical protein